MNFQGKFLFETGEWDESEEVRRGETRPRVVFGDGDFFFLFLLVGGRGSLFGACGWRGPLLGLFLVVVALGQGSGVPGKIECFGCLSNFPACGFP